MARTFATRRLKALNATYLTALRGVQLRADWAYPTVDASVGEVPTTSSSRAPACQAHLFSLRSPPFYLPLAPLSSLTALSFLFSCSSSVFAPFSRRAHLPSPPSLFSALSLVASRLESPSRLHTHTNDVGVGLSFTSRVQVMAGRGVTGGEPLEAGQVVVIDVAALIESVRHSLSREAFTALWESPADSLTLSEHGHQVLSTMMHKQFEKQRRQQIEVSTGAANGVSGDTAAAASTVMTIELDQRL